MAKFIRYCNFPERTRRQFWPDRRMVDSLNSILIWGTCIPDLGKEWIETFSTWQLFSAFPVGALRRWALDTRVACGAACNRAAHGAVVFCGSWRGLAFAPRCGVVVWVSRYATMRLYYLDFPLRFLATCFVLSNLFLIVG